MLLIAVLIVTATLVLESTTFGAQGSVLAVKIDSNIARPSSAYSCSIMGSSLDFSRIRTIPPSMRHRDLEQ